MCLFSFLYVLLCLDMETYLLFRVFKTLVILVNINSYHMIILFILKLAITTSKL